MVGVTKYLHLWMASTDQVVLLEKEHRIGLVLVRHCISFGLESSCQSVANPIKACSLIFRHFFWRIWGIGPMDRIDKSRGKFTDFLGP